MTMMKTQKMSPLTRGLYHYECKYLEQASQDKSLSGPLKTSLAGRAILLCVSFILHAEAVCRAVYVCFLTIKQIFSQSTEELLKKQKEECSIAYDTSLRSFGALFYQKLLAGLHHDLPQEPAPMVPINRPPAQRYAVAEEIQVQHIEPAAVQEQHFALAEELFEEIAAPVNPVEIIIAAEPVVQEPIDEFQDVAPPVNPVEILIAEQPHAEEAIGEFEELEAPVNPVEEQIEQNIVIEDGPIAENKPRRTRVPVDLDALDPEIAAIMDHMKIVGEFYAHRDLNKKEPEDNLSDYELVAVSPRSIKDNLSDDDGVLIKAEQEIEDDWELADLLRAASPISEIEEPPQELTAVDEHEEKSPEEPVQGENLSDFERYQIQAEQQRAEQRRKGLVEEFRQRSKEEVQESLEADLIGAQMQIAQNNQPVVYAKGPVELFNANGWHVATKRLGDIDVGICNFAKNESILRAQHLITAFDLTIGAEKYPIQLFGFFDPQVGMRAASFLIEHLPSFLHESLLAKNNGGLSQTGICNAIWFAFLKMNEQFILANKKEKLHPSLGVVAEHGSSATVVLTLQGTLWTIQLGDSRAILDNGGEPVQLSEDPSPLIRKYGARVAQLGGTVDEDGRVEGKVEMATGFGFLSLKGAVSSRPSITRVSLKKVKPNSHLLICNRAFTKATSTAQLAKLLNHPELDPSILAQDVAYSIYRENMKAVPASIRNRPLSCMVVRLNADSDWESVGLD